MCKTGNRLSLPVLIGRALDRIYPCYLTIGHNVPTIFLNTCFITPHPNRTSSFPGDHSGEETPDTIPNSAVKLPRADGTAGLPLWESRSLPGFFGAGRPSGSRPFLI